MDFTSLYSDTQTVEINGPDGSEVFISIELNSPASDVVKAVDRQVATKASRARKGGLSGKDQERLGVDRLCALVASWSWKDGLTFDEKEPDDTEAFKRHVFNSNSPAALVIIKRINDAVEDEEGFTKG